MKNLLRLEQLGLLLLSIYLFSRLGLAWWWYPLLLMTPDLSMIGYLAGPRAGAYVYNFVHHKGLAVVLFVGGAVGSVAAIQLAGLILLGHSSIDRIFGYGLKHDDAFRHTHLGWIGRGQASAGSTGAVGS